MFGLSTKGDYGLSFLEALAERPGVLVSLKEIAQEKQLPLKYIERVAGILKRSSLIESKEGAGGGYKLTRSANEIQLMDVLKVLEGDLAVTACSVEPNSCERAGSCQMKHGWHRVNRQIQGLLSRYSLADLINGNITTNN